MKSLFENVSYNVSFNLANVRNVSLENSETDINKQHWQGQKCGFFMLMSEMSVLKIYTLRVGVGTQIYTYTRIHIGHIFQKLTKLTSHLKKLIFDTMKTVFCCQFNVFRTDKCQFQTDILSFCGFGFYFCEGKLHGYI